MPTEIQEWQQLHDKAMRFAEFAAKQIAVLKAVRREKKRNSHLKIVGVWIGGVGLAAEAVRAFAGHNRVAFAGVALGAVTGAGGATIACQDDGYQSREAAPRPTIQAPASRSPTGPPPTTRAPTHPPIAAPAPPSPTEIPTTLIPTLPLPSIELPKVKPPKLPGNGGPVAKPPAIRPPVTAPAEPPDNQDECIIEVNVGNVEPSC